MSATNYSHIEVSPVSPVLGAEIFGVDLSRKLSPETLSEIKDAFNRYSVIFFRDQKLTSRQYIRFAQLWGEINVNRFFNSVNDFPEIALVVKEAEHRDTLGGGWHTDHSYDIAPAKCSILYAIDVPIVGGDTLYASMYAACDGLSSSMRKKLESLQAWHSSRHAFGSIQRESEAYKDGRLKNSEEATQDASHPVIICHPITGKKALYVNEGFTVRFCGWTQEESQDLLNYLYQHGSKHEYQYRFKWSNGSLAIWDNLATWHCGTNDYHGQRRELHRITIEGIPIS